MRPHRLAIRAFGPFADEVVVDFDDLGEAGLFHIGGPTGAGKTTLLDGLVFALYGRVPGARPDDDVATHHRPDPSASEVELEFSIGDVRYRVRRTPSLVRPKKRGTGTTRQPPGAWLERLDGRRWVPVASSTSEVDAEVARVVGLTADQLAQVVVLPQGEYQRALRAPDRERQKLLSALFGTARFAGAAEHLAERARAAREVEQRIRATVDALVRQARGRATSTAGIVDDDADAAVLSGDAAVEPQELLAVVDRWTARASRISAAAREAADQARARAESADREAERCRARAERAARHAEVEDELRRLASEAEVISSLEAAVAAHDRAAALAPILGAHERGEAELRRCEAALEGAAAALARHIAELVGTGIAGAPADVPMPDPSAAAPALDALDAWFRTLDDAARRLSEAHARAREHHDAAALLLRRADDEREAAEADEERSRALDEALAVLDAELAHARSCEAALRGLVAQAELLAAQAAAAASLDGARERERSSEAAARLAHEAAALAGAEVIELLEQRAAGMASELAASLEAGAPCPVCGSCEHPAAASGSPATGPPAPSAAEVAAARERASSLATAAERSAAERAEAAALVERMVIEAGPWAGRADEAVVASAEAAREAAAARDLSSRATDLAAERSRLVSEAAASRGAAARRRGEADQLRSQAEARLSDAELAAAESERLGGDGVDLEVLVGAIAAAQSCSALWWTAVAEAKAAASQAATTRAEVERAAASMGFDRPELAAAAILDEAALAQARSRIERHVAERARAEAALAELSAAAEADGIDAGDDELAHDPEEAEAEARDARIAAFARERAAAVAEEVARDLAGIRATLERAAQELEAAEAESARRRRLADACAGTGNERRLSLERYVLAAHLEAIAEAASAHLAELSDGRYRLVHADGRARHGGASGLSLAVTDAWTGVQRDVATLSGGETFLASLALALGVAEVAQRHAGGRRVEALFVDEGFGSLDEEALDHALAVLDRLRAGGRLVGVVSHVAALERAIGVGLHVAPAADGTGSVVRRVTDAA